MTPVDVPLAEGTRLRWDWRVLALPSQVAEDSLLSHDYLSIAVEFDNGLDLTYMWSSTLPVGTTFGCPLPTPTRPTRLFAPGRRIWGAG